MQGFSSANLWRMRNFYIAYQKNEKLAPLVREISWTKNIIILERCKDKSRTIVEYALKDTKKPIGVSTYRLTEKLPRDLKKYLPSPEEMIARIQLLQN